MSDWEPRLGVELEDVVFGVERGELSIAGEPASRIKDAHGGALYAYDGVAVIRRVERLRRAIDDDVGIKYAVKANPYGPLLELLRGAVQGFDVASITEIEAALRAGAAPTDLSLAGPGKSDALLEAAVAHGVVISVESPHEIDRLVSLARERGAAPRILLRINPSFSLRGSGMHMGGIGSPFGIDVEEAPAVLANLPGELDFRGLHVFCGSQCLSSEALIEAHRNVFAMARELGHTAGRPLGALNVGAGFGVPYFPGDRPVDVEAVLGHFNDEAEALRAAHPGIDIELELGRWLVAEAGVYLCTVVDRKVSRGETFLITDGGMHHHLAASGNLGQVVKRNYPICVANRLDAERDEKVNVVGPLCTPLDVLARGVMLSRAAIGDTIAIFQSGAYGPTASPSGFLGHLPAGERLLR